MKLAAVQMVSGPSLEANLAAAGRLVARAAAQGANLVALPENFYLIGRHEADKLALAEPEGRGPVQAFLSQAGREHGVWIVGGTAPLAAPGGKVYGACLVFDASGRRVARYDKIHLFRFDGGGAERYDEARTVEAGSGVATCESPFGRLGLSVCYDVRFPELYRALGEVDVIFVPSAFTVPTGKAHWETLLRARAIENLAYVAAPAQGGTHEGGRRTHGHTMIVDPWGEVLAEQAEGEGLVLAEVNLERVREVRQSLPSLSNRRLQAAGQS